MLFPQIYISIINKDSVKQMSKLERSRLLNFLSKPRLRREIAEHFNVPVRLVNLHLQKAIKSGQVLVSDKPLLQTLESEKGKRKRFGEFIYVFRNSPILADGWAKFRIREKSDSISKSQGDVFSIRFVSKAQGSTGEQVFDHKLPSLPLEEKAGLRAVKHSFKTKDILTSEFHVSSAKVKLAKRSKSVQLVGHRAGSTQEEGKSLTHAKRILLFQALLKEPMHFLDLHGRFGVSKQIIRGLVKNGFLMEEWGPKTIGVQFQLTKRGRAYLKELEEAAKYEPKMRKKAFIQLKQA
jgi:hypothetical protein